MLKLTYSQKSQKVASLIGSYIIIQCTYHEIPFSNLQEYQVGECDDRDISGLPMQPQDLTDPVSMC